MKTFTTAALAVLLCATAARAEEIELVTGEKIHGDVIEQGSSTVIVDHPVLGVLSIDRSKVKHIAPYQLKKLDTGEAAVAPAAGGAAAPAPKADEKPLWAFEAELGISGSTGNSETFNAHAALRGKSDNEDRRWTFDSVYAQTKSEGERTSNNYFAQSQYDWKLEDSPWFPFARVRWDWDEFTDYDSRLEVGVGVGRELLSEKDLKVRGRAGLNGVREFGGSDDSWRLEAMLDADLDWKIDERQQLNAAVTIFPDLEDTGEWRGLLEAGYSVILNDANSVSLKIGVENEFDSHQEDPFEKNNFRYFIALLFKF